MISSTLTIDLARNHQRQLLADTRYPLPRRHHASTIARAIRGTLSGAIAALACTCAAALPGTPAIRPEKSNA